MSEVSIVMSLRDQVSSGMKSIENNARPLSKEYDELSGKIDALKKKNEELNKAYAAASASLVDAKKAVKEATGAYKESNTEANRTNLEKATAQYKGLTDRMQEFKNASSDTRKEIRNTQEDIRKMTEGSGGGSGGSSLMQGLMTAGIGRMVGQTAQQAAQYYISSSYSSQVGNVLSSALGNAISGAAIGSLAGPVGTLVGGVIGGITGAVSGAVQNATEEDSSMRSYASTLVNTVNGSEQTRLSSGSATAAQREQDLLSFGTLLGSGTDAQKVLGDIKTMSNVTPYIYDELTGIAKTLIVYGDDQKTVMGHLTTVGDTGAALGMTTSEMDSVAQILGYIGSSDTLDAMRLKQLRLKGINANQMLADYYGISSTEFNTRVSKGKISGADASGLLYQLLGEKYGGMMEQQATTFTGLTSTVEGLVQNIQNAMGESFNATRSDSMERQISWLDGSTGAALSSAYGIVGEAQGLKSNLEEQIYRDVMSGVLQGTTPTEATDDDTVSAINDLRTQYLSAMDEYNGGTEQNRMEAGAKMESILSQAEGLASSSADANKKLDAWDQAAIDTSSGIANIVTDLGSWRDAWDLAQTNSRGRAAYADGGENPLMNGGIYNPVSGAYEYSNAYGESYIPYNGYRAVLHQGEAVLTAEENRRTRSGGSVSVSFAGANFTVRQDSDIDAIAEAIAIRLERAQLRGEG